MITISSDGSDRAVTVPGGEEISVTLAENPTTGYRWAVESVAGDLSLVSSDFSAAADVKPGAAGRRTILLRAGAHGHGELRLRYERAWESGSADVRRCRLTFSIE